MMILAFLSLALLSGLQTQTAHALSSNPSARNVTLYWHYATTQVSVGGIQTNYVLNSTSQFDLQTQQAARQYSFYKASGLSSIVVDFYAYPNLAGPAILNGTWQVFVSMNSSGYHPTIFNLDFREYQLGSGTAAWDSGQINPVITSSVGSYVDVPIYSYNLTTPTTIAHTFAQGSTIDVSVSVNDGAAADSRIWYDSPSYQSKVILPVVNPGQPSKIWTNNPAGAVRNSFPLGSQTIQVSTNVTDPFGGYDLNATAIGMKEAPVTLTVTGPSGSVLNTQRIVQLSGGKALLDNVFRYNVSISGATGNYTALVSSTDNSGNLEQLSYTFTVGTAASPSSLTTSMLIPLLIVAAVIVAALALLVMRRGRGKKTRAEQT
jgi:hypothetical protein